MDSLIRLCCASAAVAALLAVASPAHAQLALSYKLDERTSRAQQQDVVVNRCAGFNWMASIGACGRELMSRASNVGRAEGSSVYESAPVSAVTELPELGAPGQRWLRPGGGKEALIATSKTADLLLKFGSKLRMRGAEEGGWDVYRFSDVTYDSHLKTNGHKAVGVELLVPFQ